MYRPRLIVRANGYSGGFRVEHRTQGVKWAPQNTAYIRTNGNFYVLSAFGIGEQVLVIDGHLQGGGPMEVECEIESPVPRIKLGLFRAMPQGAPRVGTLEVWRGQAHVDHHRDAAETQEVTLDLV